ncbi:hypothetical protein [Brevibacillus massiliensis]|uniref:hypothetical protein n=1 Tax=Brevibacillus massiliensis TaxID=1118054 RepID=UPI0002D8564A|nr:hypothetical protein [Brevibacillus massiliensis]
MFPGTASTTPHNFVFLEGVKNALCADAAWQEGFYREQPTKGRVGARLRRVGIVTSFLLPKLYLEHGYSSLEDFLVGYWEAFFLSKDANNLLSMAWTWQHGDIGMTPGCDGDREKALRRIKAKAMILPGQTDLYFTPEDMTYEAKFITHAEVRVIPSIYGHFAGIGFHPVDTNFIDNAIKELLES